MNMQYTSEAILNVEKTGSAGIDNLNSNYYSQVYSLSHNDNIKNIKLSAMGADNIKITDINNNVISDITNANKIKVLVPVSSVTENKNIMLNFRTESLQTSVMFGVTNVADRQNMGLLLDPVNFRTVQSQFNINYTTENIVIEKLDKDTGKKVKGVTFRFEKLDGTNLGEFTTDSNGYISIDVKKDLKLYTEQKIRVKEVNAPSNYTINPVNSRQLDIKWGTSENITFHNEKKKGQIRAIKVDLDNNEVKLQGVEFNVLNSKGEVVDTIKTNVNGEAISKYLPIDDTYKVQETKTLQNYVLSNETKTVTLAENQISYITFKNEKKKGQIRVIKVDLDNNEVRLQGVEFNILDSKGKVVDTIKTNANGEATSKRLAIDENYTIQETKTLQNYVLSNETKTVALTENQIFNVTFKNEKKKGQIKVIKVDLDNNEVRLQGIEFNILDSKGKVVDTIKTNANGEATSKRLAIDENYTIQETKTLQNYVLSNETKKVTLTENQISNVTFKNEKKKGQIRVIKVDLDNNEVKLQGVEFNVLDSKGKVVDTIKTNANGEAITQGLPIDDTYTLQETKTLDNYVLNEEVQTVILKENEITDITFENEKKKGKIKVIKLSSEDNKYTDFPKNKPLKDVEFEILDINKNVVDTIKTDNDGIAITKDLVKGIYYIRESKQADYYLLNEELYEVEIVNHKDLIEQVILNDNVDIDIEIEKTGFIETQNKDNIYYNFKNIHNKSNVPLDNFTWNDAMPTEAVRLDKIYTGTWNEKLEYSVWYKTNKNDFRMFIDKLDTEVVYELDFNTLELEDDEYIMEFEFRFGTVKIDFQEIEAPIVYVNILDNLKNGFTFTNKTKVSGNYLEEKIEDKDDWTTIIYNRRVKLNKELPKTGF